MDTVTEPLEFTGERFTPECVREIWYEHMHRYALAADWVAGCTVLDAACGEGYGSAMLADSAGEVTGVDLSEQAIDHARTRYSGRDNLRFEVADATRLPFEDGAFDRIVSFETIEHLAEQELLLAEFRRVLTPEGLLILSSPDRETYNAEAEAPNEFHVRELDREELTALLSKQFPAVRLLGQRLMFHSVIGPETAPTGMALLRLDGSQRVSVDAMPPRPMYYLALCAASQDDLPAFDAVSLFDDAAQSVYRHYHGEIRRNMAAGGVLAEREAERDHWRERAERAERRLAERDAPWWRRWFDWS